MTDRQSGESAKCKKIVVSEKYTENDVFDLFVVPEPNSGCWLWTGVVDRENYGYIYVDATRFKAHRYMWVLRNGRDVPAGMQVQHLCDNPLCVNPDHLVCGTGKQNTAYMMARKRDGHAVLYGADNPSAKINDDDVRAILKSSLKASALAAQYGISKSAIHRIVRGEAWTRIFKEQAHERS